MARLEGRFDSVSGKFDAVNAALIDVKSQNRELRGLMIGTAAAILIGVLAMLIGLKQVWIGGVQVGQVTQDAARSSAPQSGASRP